MFNSIKKLSQKIADNLFLSYSISFIIGSIIFLIIIIFNNWNWNVLIENPSLLSLTFISGIILKFLSGAGIMITYGTVSIMFFKLFSSSIKGKKKRAERLKLFILILAVLICGYGVYNLINAILYKYPTFPIIEKYFNPPKSLFEQIFEIFNLIISLVFGLWSLIIIVYIIPTIRSEFHPFHETTTWEKIRGKFSGLKYSIWRGYQSRFRKDFGKIFASEYEKYRNDMMNIRDQLSGLLLIPFTFILVSFPMLMGIVFMLWIRLFSLDYKIYTVIERTLLFLSVCVVLIAGTIIFLFADLGMLLPFFNISYAIGIFTSAIIFSYVI